MEERGAVEWNSEQLEQLAGTLETSDHYRVLRRLVPRPLINPPDGTPVRLGLFVDVETTGLESSTDEVIELAMVPFTFGLNGRIYEVRRPFRQLAEPGRPLSTEVQRLTGLTDAVLEGQRIDLFEVGDFVSPADLVIAHHAQFDRPFLERLSPIFSQKPWACSMSQIAWRSFGYESTKLEYLAMKSGFFFEGHRAVLDCVAGIELLASRVGDTTAMARLLAGALKTGWRLSVTGSTFDAKVVLREHGYKWTRNRNTGGRCWEVEVDSEADRNAQLEFLRSDRFSGAAVHVTPVTPFDRFSTR